MKIVSFEDSGPRLGVVEGENVIDLQASDANAPTGLGDWLRRSNGDLKALADLAAKAPAATRRPLAGLKFALPVRTPGEGDLSCDRCCADCATAECVGQCVGRDSCALVSEWSGVISDAATGAVYVRSLLWAQLRLAVGVLAAMALLIGGLPLLFTLAPELLGRTVFGMPLTWGLLGFLVYPLLLALGWVDVRRAVRNERSFSDLVER